MNISKEFKIGLLALVAGAALYLGFNFLKGSNFFSSANHYYVMYSDIKGLTVSNPVTVNGFQVGRVREIKILQKDNNKMLVDVALRGDLVLGKDASIKLGSVDLLSGMQLMLNVGKADLNNPDNNLQHGDTIKNAAYMDGMLDKVTKHVEPLTKKIDSTLIYVNELLKELGGTGTKVKEVLSNTASLTGTLDNTLKTQGSNIDVIMRNLKSLSVSLIETEKSVKPIIAKIDNIASKAEKLEIDKTIQKVENTVAQLNEVIESINQGQGTMGKLIKNDSLYNNLERLTGNLDKVLIDFRENPKKYVHFSVFGKKDKKKKDKKSKK
ncbi:MlaD family protein [uncultured Microscilla sp.]|uniref:MlaD family protein n=1 Tax=uncultured Microscilla sp. TaxID=432653 RepID=UPI0026391A92|nr:MlaD family protein [uncultured Microscilla sp.]